MIVDMNTGQPNFSATPQNPDLLRWVGIQVAVVVLAWLIGMIVRRFLASIRSLTLPREANLIRANSSPAHAGICVLSNGMMRWRPSLPRLLLPS